MVMTSTHPNPVGELQAARHRMLRQGVDNPVVMRLEYADTDPSDLAIKGCRRFPALCCSTAMPIGIEIVSAAGFCPLALALGILQAARECASARRNLSVVLRADAPCSISRAPCAPSKRPTSHLSGLKIGVMGCIMNGPGEMADADYGYVRSRRRTRQPFCRRRECAGQEYNLPRSGAIDQSY